MKHKLEEQLEETTSLTGTETKTAMMKRLIQNIRQGLDCLDRLITDEVDGSDVESLIERLQTSQGEILGPTAGGRVIEGVFDGEHMIGSDGKQYAVAPNYASKSKLVEGDIMKLSIQPNGSFLYKQIGPIERTRAVGTLVKDELTNDWKVLALGRKFAVLSAAVSYYKGDVGDEIVILIPESEPSKWAAVENIIHSE
ncbi:hypothetical protein KBC54_00945 [Patescibacteria group bacterium]|nr:hypothetical protein [Patescibacteria group bacterium]